MQCALDSKGKVERPFRYIRQDFFLARRFRNLGDLNAQLRHWLDTVANVRVHATTQQVVASHFARERPQLLALPAEPFNDVIRLERRVSSDGYVSVGGNYYSVPDTTRRRVLEVHSLAREIRVYEDGQLVASHPVLEGQRQCSLLPEHRRSRTAASARAARADALARHKPPRAAGSAVARRELAFYEAVGHRLANIGRHR